jgi:predicted alpha/beta-fold hydrolase
MFHHPAIGSNPNLHLMATRHGGHLGFLARRGQRFWVDEVALDFIGGLARRQAKIGMRA